MNQNKGPLIKFGSPDNFKDVIAVRDVHVLTYNDHNGNVATIFCDTLEDAQAIKEDIQRHHPTSNHYSIHKYLVFKGVK